MSGYNFNVNQQGKVMSKSKFFILIILISFLSAYVIDCHAQQKNEKEEKNKKEEKRKKTFKDPEDGAFDISYYMYNLHGFLPVPTLITEPAVGYGGALAGAFFIQKKNIDSVKFQMPDIVGIAGGYTQNQTWFTGAGYIGFWKQDRIRYRGVLGYADVKLKYYGEGEGFLSQHPVDFRIKSYVFLQQMTGRLGKSNFMLGGKYLLLMTTVTLFDNSDLEWLNPKDFNFTSSGAGLIAEYESFDIILSPSKGWRIHADYVQNFEFLGSDRNYGILRFFTLWYQPVTRFWFSGLRIAGYVATGDPPFYMLPFVDMRGIPAMRYQGEITALAETEQHFNLTKRWSVLGFGGYGRTFFYSNDRKQGSNSWSAGTGFRYLIARLLGLRMGIDVAKGPDDWAFYVVFGSAWLR